MVGINVEVSFQRKPPGEEVGGGGRGYFQVSIMAYTGRGIFFRLQVYDRERISLVEVYERVGKSVHIFDL